jgi:hypothetical protein
MQIPRVEILSFGRSLTHCMSVIAALGTARDRRNTHILLQQRHKLHRLGLQVKPFMAVSKIVDPSDRVSDFATSIWIDIDQGFREFLQLLFQSIRLEYRDEPGDVEFDRHGCEPVVVGQRLGVLPFM